MERAEPGRPDRPDPGQPQLQPRERARPGPRRPMRADMRLRDLSLRQDPDLRQELASLARGCDFVLPSRFKKRLKAFQQVQTRKEEPLPPAASLSIPTFYFPRGRPQDAVNVDATIAKIERTFAQFPHERATMGDMGRVAKVIQRIFYTVNRSWSGRITCAELRRSTFLQNVALLEDEVDINQLTEFFSYEHFYVIYCKFWELDTDHDLLIDAQDLARHNDHAISTKMIERVFSGAVTRGKKVQKEGKISYADFVWFLISEEDKKTPTSIEYWFRCMDLDGDGVLSMFELEYFYEEQCRRLDSMAVEALPFEDCLCQMLDLVKPQSEGRITLHDLKRCKLANVFFDTFFNIEKYLDHEQREQISLFRESESEGPELSDWERYAAEEYDILVAEEAMGEPWEDGYEAELSPVDQKLSALRSPLAQRPFFEVPTGLGAVELYEYERGGDDLPPS
ncbi:serine/threonine-protein phosphatase 2A regulatory subunit B'' subunit beta isoform X3 [Physeter macrocephalus]|uniref:Serine/threonine-protein phosphatase 2A regulatory subunit B'' subunit beta isoform X3 n=1 Tax=Physeter macrocephalus TaxID=9755 RepID=A0A9W2WSK7_PHYMC|nr:serine/threonine-protein phosphatase 2A regulatory subunit B'' subunit beta isoform X3 [Physeter catodon]